MESLLDVGFMFPVRNRDGGVMRDGYVVASCLPDHVLYSAQGVCFALNGKHLVLVHQRRTAGGKTFIDGYAHGSVNSEKAGRT